jgi:hypothetical protein
MPRARDVTIVTILILAAGAWACGPRWHASPAAAGTPCTGQRYLEVRNDLGTTVDVYAYGAVSGGPRFLGRASSGTERIPLGEDVGHVYAEVGGRRVDGPVRGNPGGVSFTRTCEPARS